MGTRCLFDSSVEKIKGYSRFPVVKNPPANAEDIRDVGSPLDGEDPLEESRATNSSFLAWRIPGQKRLADYSPKG